MSEGIDKGEVAIANTTGIRTLAPIGEAVPVRLMKRDLLFVADRLASLLDENRLSIVARRYGIKKAKDSVSRQAVCRLSPSCRRERFGQCLG